MASHVLPCLLPPAGAKIEDRFLAARDPSGVQPPGHLPGVSGAEASAGSDGSMQGTIKASSCDAGSYQQALSKLEGGHVCMLAQSIAELITTGRPSRSTCPPVPLSWQVLLDSSAAGDPAFPIICAAGPVDSGGLTRITL